MTVEKRIEALEKQASGGGPLVWCYLFDTKTWEMLPPAEQEAALGEAHAEAGADGDVLVVTFDDIKKE